MPFAVVRPMPTERTSLPPATTPKLFDQVRTAINLRHYSPRTAEAYVAWARRYILFHGKRHPRELGVAEVTAFLSGLAVKGASASTQNQALSAILFLYEAVLGQRLPRMETIVRAQRPVRLPVVLSRDEVGLLLGQIRGVVWLMAALLYGSGLRLLECAELRVKRQHEADLAGGLGAVALPGNLRAKYPAAPFEWAWQWVFPATRFYQDAKTGHRDVGTTMIYTHVLNQGGRGVRSPSDQLAQGPRRQ